MSLGKFGSFSSSHIDEMRDLYDEVDRLRTALGEIANLTDVNADEAPEMARRALKK